MKTYVNVQLPSWHLLSRILRAAMECHGLLSVWMLTQAPALAAAPTKRALLRLAFGSCAVAPGFVADAPLLACPCHSQVIPVAVF